MVLVDAGSKNGTFAAACRVTHVSVPPGGEIRIGTTILRVVPEDEPIAPVASESSRSGELVGASAVMRELFTLIAQVARTDLPVLVEGELGTGKRATAREVHRLSRRSEQPFVMVDCATVDDDDAIDAGFGDAHGGTLCLVELGELSVEHQRAVLRILDRKLARPPASAAFRSVDVRVIATTRHDLGARITAGRFREDLYYRLAVVRVVLPALHERREDLALLVEHFANGRGLAAAARAALASREWPGNVAELRAAVESLLAGGDVPVALSEAPREQRTFRDAKATAVETFERQFFTELMAHHGSLAAAADAAGMDRKHLRVLLRRYGLWSG